jgi:hypothetical protein
MSRIGLDSCCKSQEDLQNVASCNYTTQNYFAADCTMKTPINLATSQPGIMYNGTSNVGSGGCVVDDSSKLLFGSRDTHPKCKIDLYQRPFATVPYLGRGSVDPVLESQIQQGEMITNKRSITRLPEKSYLNYTSTPLLSNISNRINNPAYCVENVASDGWVRGGIPSRELTKDRS